MGAIEVHPDQLRATAATVAGHLEDAAQPGPVPTVGTGNDQPHPSGQFSHLVVGGLWPETSVSHWRETAAALRAGGVHRDGLATRIQTAADQLGADGNSGQAVDAQVEMYWRDSHRVIAYASQFHDCATMVDTAAGHVEALTTTLHGIDQQAHADVEAIRAATQGKPMAAKIAAYQEMVVLTQARAQATAHTATAAAALQGLAVQPPFLRHDGTPDAPAAPPAPAPTPTAAAAPAAATAPAPAAAAPTIGHPTPAVPAASTPAPSAVPAASAPRMPSTPLTPAASPLTAPVQAAPAPHPDLARPITPPVVGAAYPPTAPISPQPPATVPVQQTAPHAAPEQVGSPRPQYGAIPPSQPIIPPPAAPAAPTLPPTPVGPNALPPFGFDTQRVVTTPSPAAAAVALSPAGGVLASPPTAAAFGIPTTSKQAAKRKTAAPVVVEDDPPTQPIDVAALIRAQDQSPNSMQ